MANYTIYGNSNSMFEVLPVQAVFKRFAAAAATFRPVATLPVKQIKSTYSIKVAPVSLPPSTKVKTSRKWGTVLIASMRGAMKRGAISLGLTIAAQPANNAGMVSIVESRSGKFQGLITPTKG